jgi:hypothetical protein
MTNEVERFLFLFQLNELLSYFMPALDYFLFLKATVF